MTDARSFENKVAIITGAAGAIGAETAVLMAERGAKIVAVDIAGANVDVLKERIDADRLVIVEADVSDEASVRNYVEEAKRAFGGRIDVFFNNAGIEGPVKPIGDYPLDAFKKVMAVNVDGVFFGAQVRAAGDAGAGRRRDRQLVQRSRAERIAGYLRL